MALVLALVVVPMAKTLVFPTVTLLERVSEPVLVTKISPVVVRESPENV
jgi:hypothetical protein